MAKFLSGSDINASIERIIREGEDVLVLMSPYIKVHHRFKNLLKLKMDAHNLQIKVLFGKNEGSLEKSFFEEDFEFFKQFPNIEIKHEARLHAKFYANEKESLLTSMNLYDYSSDNNIEFGVLTSTGLFSNIKGDNLDKEAYNYFFDVFSTGTTKYLKEPRFEKKMLGFKSNYLHSEVITDIGLRTFHKSAQQTNGSNQHNLKSNNRFIPGFCIRTGVPIPFNPERPMSIEAYRTWSQYMDTDYPERYCHFSGEYADGETSFAYPILRKNWQEAKKHIN